MLRGSWKYLDVIVVRVLSHRFDAVTADGDVGTVTRFANVPFGIRVAEIEILVALRQQSTDDAMAVVTIG
jgi:hypothetical protein